MGKVPSKIKVGTYRLGWRFVELWVETSGNSGRVVTGISKNPASVMTIGINDNWRGVVGTLTHEAFEVAAWDEGCQYERAGNYAQTTSGYFFSFDHLQFTEIANKVGAFMADVLPDVSAHYRKLTKKNK